MTRGRLISIVFLVSSLGVVLLTGWTGEAFGFGQPWQSRLVERGPWQLAGFENRGPLENLALQVGTLLGHLFAGVLILFIAPKRMRNLSTALKGGLRGWLRLAAIGLLLATTLVSVALLSALTVYTFLLPFIVMGLLFLTALTGSVAVAYRAGEALVLGAGWDRVGPIGRLAAGIFVLFAVSRIPRVGLALIVLAWSIGLGVVATTRFGSGTRWSLEALREKI